MITPNTPVKLTMVAIVPVIIAVWSASSAFGGKADKGEVDSLRNEVSSLRERWIKGETILQSQLEILAKMDKRMERIESKQDYMIQEQYKRWNHPSDSTPPPR